MPHSPFAPSHLSPGWRSRRNYPAILKCPAGDVMVMYGWLLWAETNWNITIIIQLQHSTGEGEEAALVQTCYTWALLFSFFYNPQHIYWLDHPFDHTNHLVPLTARVLVSIRIMPEICGCVCFPHCAPFSELCSIFVSVIITFNTP